MRSHWLLALACAGLIIGIVAAACGGGGEPKDDEEAQGLLEQMVLTVEDLPAGLQRVSAAFSTNEELAKGQASPKEEQARIEAWGRRLGYDVAFVPSADTPPDLPVRFVQVAASLYDTPEGAGASFADAVSAARATDWKKTYTALTDVEATEVNRPGVEGERFWMRVSGLESQEPPALLVDDQVVFRVGSVRAYLRVGSVFANGADRTVYMEQVEQWVRLLSQRIADVLAGRATP